MRHEFLIGARSLQVSVVDHLVVEVGSWCVVDGEAEISKGYQLVTVRVSQERVNRLIETHRDGDSDSFCGRVVEEVAWRGGGIAYHHEALCFGSEFAMMLVRDVCVRQTPKDSEM